MDENQTQAPQEGADQPQGDQAPATPSETPAGETPAAPQENGDVPHTAR